MSLIRFNNYETLPAFSNLLEDMFGRDMFDMSNRAYSASSLPAVNIKEEEKEYEVEVAVPGMKKDDFNITLENNMLTISSEKEHKEEEKDKKGNYTRREFSYQAFKRTFAMPDNVNADKIKAEYHDGILSIHLPKKEEAKTKHSRQIKIS
jgi:HSP20 family protein